ncbi:MBOAT family O-acyltransferase [Mesorhizobium sp. L-8-10]|uniref:MBOAT family O-acyltransferase n=1 Tax=Mesorhizobium sp. L-8-10 TaxID=2744523 RepID=UPI0019255A8E|nr:MBOAT family protein [Mesorhizobium sp. L-8-10]
MVFNQLQFFPFFLAIFILYFALPGAVAKKILLIVASYIFYALFNPWYILLLGAATIYTWLATEFLVRLPQQRRLWMWLGVAGPLALLGYFKYAMFVEGNVAWLFDYWGIHRNWSIEQILLPAGISFYLFHSVSYVVDVYRGAKTATFLDYILYVAFFPQLVSGPIVRRKDFIPQTENPDVGRLDWKKVNWGLVIFVFGLFQKAVLADGVFADAAVVVFESAERVAFADAWIGVLAFTGQIFFDFAGYSTCAIGISLCFGYRLPINFHYPYAAIGFSDFWQRWHISLSSWLRDYLYISLGGNRGGTFKTYCNLMLTMVLGGLWHGAAWTFVAWGTLHGSYLVAERLIRSFEWRSKGWLIVGWAATFILTVIAWVFFRAASFSDAASILQAMASPGAASTHLVDMQSRWLVSLVMLGTLVYSFVMRDRTFAEVWAKLPLILKSVLLGLTIFLIVVWRGEPREFIYFAF